MVNHKNTAEELNVWPEVTGESVEIFNTKNEKMNVRRAVNYFLKIEENCDALIQEQDMIIRSVMHRPTDTAPELSAEGFYLPTSPAQNHGLVSASDMPYPEYKLAYNVANKVVKKQLPMATNRFMRQAGSQQIDAIESLEIDIDVLRQHMTNVEAQILDAVPSNIDDVAAKLKFMSMLMLDGGTIEIDYFAYLVEECAEVIQELKEKE